MKEQAFQAPLQAGDRSLGWTVAAVPFDTRAVWPERLRLRVCGTIAGPAGLFCFRSSLFPQAGVPGRFYLLVNRAMQAGAGVQRGDMATFTLQADLDERAAELPEELDALLDEAEGLRAWYESASEYMRREIGKWISAPKGEAARHRRAEQMAERMLSTMEAETELPPLIKRAFQHTPKAAQAWQKLTPTHRRAHLFALFYYQTPDAREKRLRKLVEDLLAKAEQAR